MTKSPPVVLLEGQAPPRVRHAPARPRRSSWEDVADLSAQFGVVLDEWQELVLQAALGERSDGAWATPQVAVCTPRQNGKSEIIVIRALAGLLLFNEQTIIVSAHEQDTAREVFTRLVDIFESHPSLDRRVANYGKAVHREYIRLKTGQVIRFKARSAGAGRGFSCDCLLLDEAQILGSPAWAAILPTMSARPNPQVWLFGTAPTPQDNSEVFTRFRQAGLEGRESRLVYLEWAADPNDDMDDPGTWAKANPAFGTRISHDAISDERTTMSDDEFGRERLGLWDDADTSRVISQTVWADVGDNTSVASDRFAVAVDVAPDRSSASIAMAGQRLDGLWHVELGQQRSGVSWLVPYLKTFVASNPQVRAVVIDGVSPAASIIDELLQAKIKVTTTSAREMASACGTFFDGVHEQWLRHTDQAQLNVAVSVARKRSLGDQWAWNRKSAHSDITPLVACTLALFGAQSSTVKKPARSGKPRRGVVL